MDVQREQEAVLSGGKFVSAFHGHENCKWSVWSEYGADKILEHVRGEVFDFMRVLGGGDSFSKYMKSANFEIPNASLLIEAVKIINDMHIKEQNQDSQGDMYEYLLSELQTAGKNGQFRTPRHIIQMMIGLAKPRYDDMILDPACGTAGFLVNTYQYILDSNKKDGVSTLSSKRKQLLDEDNLYGFDIDQTMTRIALMNMMMHGIKKPNVSQLNTLSKRYKDNTYDLILANPPFKGSIDESEMSDEFTIKTKKTELLFLELMYNSLTNGGRCAVIVPDGVLFGSSKAHRAIRKMSLEDLDLMRLFRCLLVCLSRMREFLLRFCFLLEGSRLRKFGFMIWRRMGFRWMIRGLRLRLMIFLIFWRGLRRGRKRIILIGRLSIFLFRLRRLLRMIMICRFQSIRRLSMRKLFMRSLR